MIHPAGVVDVFGTQGIEYGTVAMSGHPILPTEAMLDQRPAAGADAVVTRERAHDFKRPIFAEWFAQLVCAKMRIKYDQPDLAAYPCPFPETIGPHWHVGHPPVGVPEQFRVRNMEDQ